MPSITVRDGTHIHVKAAGQSRPVVLVHGWPLTGDMWEHQSLALIEAGNRTASSRPPPTD